MLYTKRLQGQIYKGMTCYFESPATPWLGNHNTVVARPGGSRKLAAWVGDRNQNKVALVPVEVGDIILLNEQMTTNVDLVVDVVDDIIYAVEWIYQFDSKQLVERHETTKFGREAGRLMPDGTPTASFTEALDAAFKRQSGAYLYSIEPFGGKG